MKRLLSLALALVLVLSLTACNGKLNPGDIFNNITNPSSSTANNSTNDPGNSGGNSGNSGNSGNQGNSGGNFSSNAPAAAYEHYVELKGQAYDLISESIGEHPELVFSAGMALLGVVFIDLALIPLTLIGTEGSEFALALLGMEGFEIKQNGNVYTMTYSNGEGESMTQTCEYDPATDSMQSIMSVSGSSSDSMVFEYVKSGNGYVSQYVTSNEDGGNYSVIKMYFDGNNVAIGLDEVSSVPGSIFKKTGLNASFACSGQSYFLLEGDKLTIYENGETTVY